MSWILIFISTYVPIVILFGLVLMDRLHGEGQSQATTHAALKGC